MGAFFDRTGTCDAGSKLLHAGAFTFVVHFYVIISLFIYDKLMKCHEYTCVFIHKLIHFSY